MTRPTADQTAKRTDSLASGDLQAVTSVVIAAHNEEDYIGACLKSLLDQDTAAGELQIIVAANACSDRTTEIVMAQSDVITARGWHLRLLEIGEPGKVNALNHAERVAAGACLVYLDADVVCDPALLGQLRDVLARPEPTYATGTLRVAPGKSWVTRRYADLWVRLPFVKGGAVGAGLFAMNRAGRSRWGTFPDIISDDTFVRLNFAPSERYEVPAAYHWPMVEGFGNLVRVRRRQNAGVEEVFRLYPDLRKNDEKSSLGSKGVLALILTAPISFAIYALVHVSVKLRHSGSEWTRGR